MHVAAVDLGASSGRVVYGEIGPTTLRAKTVARFENEPVRLPDGLHWNLIELYRQVLLGVRAAQVEARSRGGELTSLGVDSWATDYGLLSHGRLLGLPYHYRDDRVKRGVEAVHEHITTARLYERNGLQFLPFNTLYQLAADPLTLTAEDLLLVPDLLGYWLTGAKATERTNASTTGLLNATTGEWDTGLAELLGIPTRLLNALVDPGEPRGTLLPSIAETVDAQRLQVTTVASHDTASAVVGTPLQDDEVAYISCGTWALVGVELDSPVLTDAARDANFTNERGADGRIRFLTNVMGLWLLSETTRGWQKDGDADPLESHLAAAATLPPARHLFDVQDSSFVAPGHMPSRITNWYNAHLLPAPSTPACVVRAILDSLAQAFAQAVDDAERLSGHRIRTIHIVGGGTRNTLLCQATADRSGRPVIAGPVEATALGNLLIQGRATGAITGDLGALRQLITANIDTVHYQPGATRTGSSQTRV